MTHDFAEYYKNISHAELLNILQNPDNYQPEAITAAKQEYEDRHLSQEEIINAQKIIDAARSKIEKKKEKLKSVENKLKETGLSIVDTLNPVQQEKTSTEKKIKIISLFFAMLSIYQLVDRYRIIKFSLKDFFLYPIIVLMDIAPLILLPAAIFLFWRKKVTGWVMLTIFLTYSFTLSLRMLTYFFKPKRSEFAFFSTSSLIPVLILLFLFGGTLYVICKPDIREVFCVNKKKMAATLIITWIVTLFLIFVPAYL